MRIRRTRRKRRRRRREGGGGGCGKGLILPPGFGHRRSEQWANLSLGRDSLVATFTVTEYNSVLYRKVRCPLQAHENGREL